MQEEKRPTIAHIIFIIVGLMLLILLFVWDFVTSEEFFKRVPVERVPDEQTGTLKSFDETPPLNLLIDIDRISGSKDMTDAELDRLEADIISQLSELQKSNKGDLVVKALKSLCRYLTYKTYLKPLETMKKGEKYKMPYPITWRIFTKFPREAVITLSTLLMSDVWIINNMGLGASLILKDIYDNEMYPGAREEIRNSLSFILSSENMIAKMGAIMTVAFIPVRELYTLTEFNLINIGISLLSTNAMENKEARELAELLSEVSKTIKDDRKKNPDLQPQKQYMLPLMMMEDQIPIIKRKENMQGK